MKKIFIVIGIIAIIAVAAVIILLYKQLPIFNNDANTNPDTEDANMIYMTPADFLEFVDLSQEDIPYVNVDLVMQEHGLTKEFLKKVKEDNLTDKLCELLLEENEKNKYELENSFIHMVLLDSIERPETFSYEHCKRIVLSMSGDSKDILIDFVSNKIYQGGKVLVDVTKNTEKTIELTDDIKTAILSYLNESELDKCENRYYVDTDNDSFVGYSKWTIAFECDEGVLNYTSYVFSGDGEIIVNLVEALLDYLEGLL